MHLPTRLATLVVGALVVVAGCTGSGGSPAAPSASAVGPAGSATAFLPVPVSSEFGVGDNRVVFGLLDPTGTNSAASPDRTLSIGYHGPNGETIPSTPQTFVWAVEGVKGVYVGRATFPHAGRWIADFTSAGPGGAPQTFSFSF